jgi:hypothetical protein
MARALFGSTCERPAAPALSGRRKTMADILIVLALAMAIIVVWFSGWYHGRAYECRSLIKRLVHSSGINISQGE